MSERNRNTCVYASTRDMLYPLTSIADEQFNTAGKLLSDPAYDTDKDIQELSGRCLEKYEKAQQRTDELLARIPVAAERCQGCLTNYVFIANFDNH